jgi:hypothetical protein
MAATTAYALPMNLCTHVNRNLRGKTVRYDTAHVLAAICYQANATNVRDAVSELTSGKLILWKDATEWINWMKNEANEWAEHWDDPFCKDFTVAELQTLAANHLEWTLSSLEAAQCAIEDAAEAKRSEDEQED